MATLFVFKPDDFAYRTIVPLGSIADVRADGSVNGIFSSLIPIFNTGNIRFPTGNNRVYVAYVVIETSDGNPLPLNSSWGFGTNPPTPQDWNFLSLNAAPWDIPANMPIVIGPYPFAATQPFVANMPVYTRGQTFYMRCTSGPATSQTLKVTAWGWAE